MATDNIEYNRSNQWGVEVYSGCLSTYNGRINIQTAIGHMTAMLGGRDPSQETSFDIVAARYEIATTAEAKKFFDECNAYLAQLTTIEAAIEQARSRLT